MLLLWSSVWGVTASLVSSLCNTRSTRVTRSPLVIELTAPLVDERIAHLHSDIFPQCPVVRSVSPGSGVGDQRERHAIFIWGICYRHNHGASRLQREHMLRVQQVVSNAHLERDAVGLIGGYVRREAGGEHDSNRLVLIWHAECGATRRV